MSEQQRGRHAKARPEEPARKPAHAKKPAGAKPSPAKKKPTASKKSGAVRAKSAPKKRRRAKKKALSIGTILRRSGLCVATLLILVLFGALAAGRVAFKGPSESLGDLLTVSMLETSALKFIPRIYYSQAQVDEIIARNSVDTGDRETDASLIVIAGPTPEPGSEVAAAATPRPSNLLISEDGIEIFDVQGSTYNGWMMVVQDPSRVVTGVCRENFNSKPGLELYEIAERYNAVAAINGGGFSDSGGVGNGGQPSGLVIAGGQVLNKGGSGSHDVVVGFNQDNVLIVGNMTSKQALEKGIRDALAFGPALVINGEAAKVKGASSGLNPRTAIGQLDYGAVNAINLDGGSSSLMYYKGEYLNRGVILTGSRTMPTGFVVR